MSSSQSTVPLSCPQCEGPWGEHVFDVLNLVDKKDSWDRIADTFLNNNLEPGVRETDVFRERLEKDREEKDWAENAITRLSALLPALKEFSKRKESRMKIYSSALNPVRRIPKEILSKIFMWCIDDTGLDPRLAVEDPVTISKFLLIQRMPWTISHVCSSWRQLSISIPDLWSNIFYRYPSRPGCNQFPGQSNLNLLGCRLENTGSCPISVTIVADTSFPTPMPPFLNGLIISSPRWKSLRLCIPQTSDDFLQGMEYMFKRLQAVSIDYITLGQHLTSPDVLQRSFSALGARHNICSLSCHPALAYFFQEEVLKRMTRYSTPTHPKTIIRPLTVLKSLDQMPNLQASSICCSCQTQEDFSFGISLNKLSSLTLTEDLGTVAIRIMLKNMSLPSLRHLAIYSESSIDSIINSQILARSKANVRSLTLGLPTNGCFCQWDEDEPDLDFLISIFEACPTIRRLTLGASLSLQALRKLLDRREVSFLSSLTLLREGMLHKEMVEMRVEAKRMRPSLAVQFEPRSLFLPPVLF